MWGDRTWDHEKLLDTIAHYLRREGVEATVSSELPSNYGLRAGKQAIQLAGQPIESIWVITNGGGQYGHNHWSVSFRVALHLDRPLTKELKKALSVRTDPRHEAKWLVFGTGKLLEVRWVVGPLAESLNRDSDLSRMIFEYVSGEEGYIWIRPRGGAWVDISTREWSLGEDCDIPSALPFELYSKIAEHIHRIARTLG